MDKKTATKLKKIIKSVLSKYNEVYVGFDRRDENKVKISFAVLDKRELEWLGSILIYTKDDYKVLSVITGSSIILYEEMPDLSPLYVIEKVLDIAKSVGFEVSFTTGDYEEEKFCNLTLTKS